jgi:Tol biopolymer transport system component
MGIVFRARDTQLLRDVALKFLPDHFATDPDRLGRFQREAQVLASLNHPNIAQIYGFQQTANSGAIVMELVEGETLADRLKCGPLALEQVILISRQIVEALDAAHKRNIIHRDLKPANIKVTPDGKVKVLDFGLAKALADEDSALDASNSPTMMSRSIVGAIMGTAAYMSPEQARGSTLDARTDIWSFGCVLYELLTAKPVFTGATVTDIIAKVIESQPDWNLLPPETPNLMRTLLLSALTKDRAERLQHIDDARVFLNTAEIPTLSAAPARARARGKIVTAALAIALAAALVPAARYFLQTPEEKPEIRFEIPVPGITPAISHDGQTVAYTAQSGDKTAIWIRPMKELKAHLLPGTENGGIPFWSPDDRYLGFFADGNKLKKIPVGGGNATTLTDMAIPAPGDWSRDGIILFSAVAGTAAPAIVSISESGGPVTQVTKPTTLGHVSPQFLPDGRHFLYVETGPQGEHPALFAGSLDGASPTRILTSGDLSLGNYTGRFVLPGYLLFLREGVLMAQSFDPKRLALTGEPVTIAEHAGPVSASDQGTLVYRDSAAYAGLVGGGQLLWMDRDGKPGPSVGMSSVYNSLRLSPDGHRVAVDPLIGGNTDIWVIDLDRGIPNRLTVDPARDFWPIWSPDGKRIVFTSLRGAGTMKIFQRSAIAIGGDEAIPIGSEPDNNEGAADWSPDGMYLVFMRNTPKNPSAVEAWIKPMSGDGKPFLYSAVSRNFGYRIAPNGRWIAYVATESGINQVVVQTFPDPKGGTWQVTARGGVFPTWRGDSGELYYIALDGKLMAVPVKEGSNFEPGEPKALFQTPLTTRQSPTPVIRYDASHDGKRFLFIAPATTGNASGTTSETMTAIVNWTAALRKK